MNAHTLTEQLKEYALAHSVDLIGVTSAKPFVKQDGKGTTIDPKEFLDEPRAVVVTGFYMNEVHEAPAMDRNIPRGRFTHGYSVRAYMPMERHYIATIRDFLKQNGYRAAANRHYRLPDKMAAVRAGLGKYGKNSVVLTRGYGSCVMFVSLVTDAPLEYEEHNLQEPTCGKCELCIKACPTGAIYAPYKVKRPLCITEWLWGSYAPIELREKQENRLFGCGECIKACPRNKKLIPRQVYPAAIDPVSTTPELLPLVSGDKEYYRKAIASFPMCAGMEAIRGNAIVALGTLRSEQAIDPLCNTLTHPRPQIRAYSAWSLGKIGGLRAKAALEQALQKESSAKVRKEIRSALGEI